MSSLTSNWRKVLIRHYLETAWKAGQVEESCGELLQIVPLNEDQLCGQADPDIPVPEKTSPFHPLECRVLPTRELLQLRRAIQHAFPDAHLTILDLLTAGEMVAARWSIRGTDLGGYDGHLPTGKVIQLTGITMMRLEGWVIVEEWNEINVIGMLRQLGIVSLSQSPRITMKRSRPVRSFSHLSLFNS